MTPQDLHEPFTPSPMLPQQKIVPPAAVEPRPLCRNPQDAKAREALFDSWLRLWLPIHLVLSVTYTRNRSTLLSFRRHADHVELRLHRLFADMGPDIAQAICMYVLAPKKLQKSYKQLLDRSIARISSNQAERTSVPQALRKQGVVHDLQGLFDGLNAAQFSGRCTAAITWGRGGSAKVRRRSITLGSYSPALNLIRIHPCLDQSFVPDFVVRGVVHHEMLHEVFGIEERGGRRRVHPPEFVVLERMYQDYDRCVAWEKAHLVRLLAYRP